MIYIYISYISLLIIVKFVYCHNGDFKSALIEKMWYFVKYTSMDEFIIVLYG